MSIWLEQWAKAGAGPNFRVENVKEYIEKTDKETPLVVCCYHGISSRGAAEYLSQQGFKEVYSMTGGFEAWPD